MCFRNHRKDFTTVLVNINYVHLNLPVVFVYDLNDQRLHVPLPALALLWLVQRSVLGVGRPLHHSEEAHLAGVGVRVRRPPGKDESNVSVEIHTA